MKRLLTWAVLAAGTGAIANASIILNLQSITANGSNFNWNYQVTLSDDQNWRSTGTIDNTTGSADFTEVIDFAGLQSQSFLNSAQCVGCTWNFSSVATGPGAPAVGKTDSAGTLNAVLKLTSPALLTNFDGSVGDVGVWTIVSNMGGTLGTGNNSSFSSQAQKNTVSDHSTTFNQGVIQTPSAVPEPTTTAMVGIGLGLMALARRRLAKKA